MATLTSYFWRDNMPFETEMILDRTHTDPVSVTEIESWRETLSVGNRRDFR